MAQATAARRPLGATLSQRQRLTVFAAIMLCMFLTALDQSIVATAIPRVLADIGGFDLLSWVFTSYLLASTVTVPIVGKLSDMFGRKTFLLWGVGIFVAASAACGAAPSMLTLILARGVQGIGAGLIVSCVFATLGDLFTPLERAKYFAFFSAMFTFAQFAGPTFGGLLADGPGWRWAFYVNLPLGIGAGAFILTQLPRGGGSGGRISDIDVRGALLLAVATIALLLGLTWAGREFGWGAPITLGLLGLAAVATAAFVLNERGHPQPIIPLALFRNVPFVQGVTITFFSAAGVFAGWQYLPTYVQTSLGASAAASGLIFAPQAVAGLLASIVGGQVIARTGKFKLQMILGGALLSTGAFLMSRFGPDESLYYVGAVALVGGVGGGLVFPVSQVVVQAAVSQDEQGVASSARQFFLHIGNTLGVAALGVVLTTSYASAFAQESRDIAPLIPAATYRQFSDPTLALKPERFAEARETVRALPDGNAILGRALTAQRSAVAQAIDHVNLGMLACTLAVLAIAIALREITLRRSFEPAGESPRPAEGVPAGATSPPRR